MLHLFYYRMVCYRCKQQENDTEVACRHRTGACACMLLQLYIL